MARWNCLQAPAVRVLGGGNEEAANSARLFSFANGLCPKGEV